MDRLSRIFYEQTLELAFFKKTGDEYQDFFSEVMEKRHPGDFQRVRPWGNVGDRKNDGYLRSERTLFQVYAPSELNMSRMIGKMEDDFCGTLPYWKGYFDHWIFVHNSRNGLAPDVSRKLLELDEREESVSAKGWGYAEVRRKVFELDEADLASLLGPAPSQDSLRALGFEDVRDVVTTIADRELPPDHSEIRPVSPSKLKFNDLSDNAQEMLRMGMRKASLVKEYFDLCQDPTLGDNVAARFKQEYEAYKAVSMTPDTIFGKLQEFAGGSRRGSPRHEAAVLAVLALLFEQCDIYESPPEAAVG